MQNLEALICSFLLKMLKHEGEFDESQIDLVSSEETTQALILLRAKKFSELEPMHLASEIFKVVGRKIAREGTRTPTRNPTTTSK